MMKQGAGSIPTSGRACRPSNDLVERINAAMNRKSAAPAIVEPFSVGGIAALPGKPDRFTTFIDSKISKYAQVVRRGKISFQ